MSTLDRTLRKGARRIATARFVSAALMSLTLATLALVGLRVAEKGFAMPAPDWSLAWSIAMGAAVALAAAWVWVTRPDRESVARLLDENLGLKATLATAVWARSDEKAGGDAWHSATVDEGERAAKRVDVRTAVPVMWPRYWFAPAVLALLAVGGAWIPQQDLMAMLAGDEEKNEQLAKAEQDRELIEIKDAVQESRDDMDAALSGIEDDALREMLDEKEEIEKAGTPEEVRNAEMRRLTGLKDRLDDLQNDAMLQSEALKEMTAQLKTPEGPSSPVTKMAEAMKRGDFKEAVQQIEALKKQLEQGEGLSEEQRQQMAQQLQQLADQLEKAAQQQQQAMRDIARQAGVPENLAGDPEALKKAIENSKNLTQQQKQQLQKKLQQCQNAGGQCKNCAGAMQQLGQCMGGGQGGQGMTPGGEMAGAMQGLQEQLSQMEALEQQLKSLSVAQGQCSGAMDRLGAQGGNQASQLPQWAQKQKLMRGGGQGAGSTGRGGNEDPTSHAEDTVVDKKKVSTVTDPGGPMISSMVAEGGEQVRGESVAQFREAAQAGGRAASDAIDERLVPKEYEEVVKRYFGGLEREAQKSQEQSAADDSEKSGAASEGS